jgi:hypothetical protein
MPIPSVNDLIDQGWHYMDAIRERLRLLDLAPLSEQHDYYSEQLAFYQAALARHPKDLFRWDHASAHDLFRPEGGWPASYYWAVTWCDQKEREHAQQRQDMEAAISTFEAKIADLARRMAGS